ncbi:16S rRNA (guanine(527)-N(7))-methyltransferase RsmG [Ectothiorhodospira lacustris]|uniref:16S rRNA (guanine(527)-N(7))-methyltransferase RsmG n=1 Tax=Ectothiorhodospira lacustris TaxID=2899127 RepID=UPI001EE80FC4|nr:16S rRNA (guanine(527)-N(7))-methyltransferase RsmG [Ectothiorhodospira lacustris]MCG5509713.1 16S rRNA (guanine(527)-N(7))-methyltransferase RsmG [Ectothiorhodospira lacustris]MCG5523054.1 16S rRNA (guanine(527)-N(7))-methyltransferase RsmG [Ectothiorhodospira lacustris]
MSHTLPFGAADLLHRGLNELSLDLTLAGPLSRYLRLMERWNRAYNLTAVRDFEDMVRLHLLDSLAALPRVKGPRIADIGTGPGLPGIPLALARPDWQVVLLDSGGKKTRFLRQAVMELGLSNAVVVQARVESYRPDGGFDTVVSRAFAATTTFTRLAGHLCAPGGQLLAMKGRDADDDPEALPAGWRVVATHSLRVPGLEAVRHLVEITKD